MTDYVVSEFVKMLEYSYTIYPEAPDSASMISIAQYASATDLRPTHSSRQRPVLKNMLSQICWVSEDYFLSPSADTWLYRD